MHVSLSFGSQVNWPVVVRVFGLDYSYVRCWVAGGRILYPQECSLISRMFGHSLFFPWDFVHVREFRFYISGKNICCGDCVLMREVSWWDFVVRGDITMWNAGPLCPSSAPVSSCPRPFCWDASMAACPNHRWLTLSLDIDSDFRKLVVHFRLPWNSIS